MIEIRELKNKKGFTLIELIAVILILGIIALIGIPTVNNIVEESKKNSAVAGVQNYIKAVNNYSVSQEILTGSSLSANSKYKLGQLTNISVKGKKPTRGSIYTDSEGTISSAKLCMNNYSVDYDGEKATISNSDYCSNYKPGSTIPTDNLYDLVYEDAVYGMIENNSLYTLKLSNDEEIDTEIYYFEDDVVYTETPTLCDDVVDTKMCILIYEGDLTVNEGVTVTPQVRKKGFTIYVLGTLTNNGTISMTARGASAVGQNVLLYKNATYADEESKYEYIPAVGANGGAALSKVSSCNPRGGKAGSAGTTISKRATGGGGSGMASCSVSGKGGKGTSYSGGTGGGGAYDSKTGTAGSDTGGRGGSGASGSSSAGGGGGVGNPNGTSVKATASYGSGTGGLLIIYADVINNSGVFSANGVKSISASSAGGASGGGSINIFYNNINNTGSYTANGGEKSPGNGAYSAYGGAGGKGTVSIGSIATGTFVSE